MGGMSMRGSLRIRGRVGMILRIVLERKGRVEPCLDVGSELGWLQNGLVYWTYTLCSLFGRHPVFGKLPDQEVGSPILIALSWTALGVLKSC
jgi:hypothetical protein